MYILIFPYKKKIILLLLVSLNYTFPRALPSAWASPVSLPQLSLGPQSSPTPAPGNRCDPWVSWASLSLQVIRLVFPGKGSGYGDRPVATSAHIHSLLHLRVRGVARGFHAPPPKFPVYGVIMRNSPAPCLGPSPPPTTPLISCHLHPMARPPLVSDHEHALWGVGLGRSELLPSSFPCP